MKMNTLIKSSICLAALAAVSLTSCKKDKDDVVTPAKPNENEVITTFKIVMTQADQPAFTSVFVWRDIDGSMIPTSFDTIRLSPNKTYNTSFIILDETKNPVDSTSNEVKEEGTDHQFFFKSLLGLNLTTTYADKDANMVPIGLKTVVKTGAASKGNWNIILKHQPEVKPKSGMGDESKGSVDINLTFPVKID